MIRFKFIAVLCLSWRWSLGSHADVDIQMDNGDQDGKSGMGWGQTGGERK